MGHDWPGLIVAVTQLGVIVFYGGRVVEQIKDIRREMSALGKRVDRVEDVLIAGDR